MSEPEDIVGLLRRLAKPDDTMIVMFFRKELAELAGRAADEIERLRKIEAAVSITYEPHPEKRGKP